MGKNFYRFMTSLKNPLLEKVVAGHKFLKKFDTEKKISIVVRNIAFMDENC